MIKASNTKNGDILDRHSTTKQGKALAGNPMRQTIGSFLRLAAVCGDQTDKLRAGANSAFEEGRPLGEHSNIILVHRCAPKSDLFQAIGLKHPKARRGYCSLMQQKLQK